MFRYVVIGHTRQGKQEVVGEWPTKEEAKEGLYEALESFKSAEIVGYYGLNIVSYAQIENNDW